MYAAGCSMRALCSCVYQQIQKNSTHDAGCSMCALCSWARNLINITSRLARQKIWKCYACCTCSMHRKTTSLTVLPVSFKSRAVDRSTAQFFLSFHKQSENPLICYQLKQSTRGHRELLMSMVYCSQLYSMYLQT